MPHIKLNSLLLLLLTPPHSSSSSSPSPFSSSSLERNLNPKAACLKKRDEEKSFQAAAPGANLGSSGLKQETNPLTSLSPTTLHPHHTLPLTPTSQTPPTPTFTHSLPSPPPPPPPVTSSQPTITTSPNLNCPLSYMLPGQQQQQQTQQQTRKAFQPYPSPPPLATGDKIPRSSEHDPPMKHRSNSGTVSPTLQKAVKGRCSTGTSIAATKSQEQKVSKKKSS